MKQLAVNGIVIEVERKRIKNMYLRVLPPDGRVYITAPGRMSEGDIKSFVLSKLDWIEKHKAETERKAGQMAYNYENGDDVYVWGRKFQLTVRNTGIRNELLFNGNSIVLLLKENSTAEQRKKLMASWYRKALIREIPFILSGWEQKIGVKASGFTVRDMKTRWGTCNIRTKNICLNLQLARKSPKFLEYVIVHELVHLLEKSHNQVFKSYMDQFLPGWRSIRKELNSSIS